MANKNKKKLLALGLAAVTASALLLVGCGGDASSNSGGSATDTAEETSGTEEKTTDTTQETEETSDAADATASGPAEADEAHTFSWMIAMPDTDYAFSTWSDSPAVQEWLADCGETIALEWDESPVSADSDFYNTRLATGEYSDVFSPTLTSSTAVQLYEEGIALDLTELVEENMPNYLKWVDAHPEYRSQIYNTVNGEEKILNIRAFNEVAEPWSALLYRRDWIVAYGTDEDGNAFEGGWQDDDKTVWEDNVVFPSGETYPKTISDWEWMLPILQTALEEQGVDDGCALSIMYRGYYAGIGAYTSGFGGTFPGWQETKDGEIEYGWTDSSDAMRAYVECMNHWYEEGWIDPYFDERSDDSIFFMVNQEAVFSGKVGVTYGLIESYTGNMLATEGDPLLENICYMAAPQPINDVYGDKSVQNVEPWHYFEAGSLLGGENIITNAAKDKDIASLLRAIDYLYGEEGCYLSMYGINAEQQAEHQYQTMIDMGLEDGAYSLDGDTIVINPVVTRDSLNVAVSLNRLGVGLNNNSDVDKGYSQQQQYAVEMAALYPGGGNIDYLTGSMPSDQQDEMSMAGTNLGNILDVSIPDFITGRVELNDENWESFQESLLEQGVDEITGYIKAMQ